MTDIDKVLAKLTRLQAGINNREAIGNAVGRALVAETQQHLRDWSNSHPNRLGGKRTHFIARAASATFFRLSPQGVELINNHIGMALRYYGGTIVPKNVKWLTIPAIKEAYGRGAREFDNLRFVPFKAGLAGLVEKKGGASDARSGRGIKGARKAKATTGYKNRVFYWLVKSATIRANRSLLPLMRELRRTASLTTNEVVRNILQK